MKNTILITSLVAIFATFTLPLDAAMRTHQITFDEMVPCVGDTVHLHGPFHITLTFSGKNLTNVEASVHGIKGAGENTRHTYAADPNNTRVATSFMVKNGVGRGHVTVTFQIVGRPEGGGNSGNIIRFWAKQIVRVEFVKNPILDFDALKVCVTP